MDSAVISQSVRVGVFIYKMDFTMTQYAPHRSKSELIASAKASEEEMKAALENRRKNTQGRICSFCLSTSDTHASF